MNISRSKSLAGLRLTRSEKIEGKKVRLRSKKLTDVRSDYRWQSDPELSKLDAAPPLTSSFPTYLLDYTDSIHRPGPNRYPMAVETLDGKHIGNCTCYDIDDNRSEAQLGIMIGEREYWDKGYGTDTINTLISYIFHSTELNRLYLKTLDWNQRAQRCFQNCGFKPCGVITRNDKVFVFMDITRERWEELKTEEQN